VQGKIVIAKYGAAWRGIKPKLAAEHGAVGCIIYSDPADDGYGAGDAYPAGAFRPERGLQRGSVLDLPVEVGDPLTPGYGAVEAAPRIARAEAKTILKIPAVPISWGDARHFLAALAGPVAPRGWRGALPFTYHVGGGDGALVHLMVRSDWSQKPIYDVIATLPGARFPDEWVIRANHRDGWVFGAQDPLAGQTAMLEEARSLGALAKAGWRPARTIVYASWDGEEPGLLGSTEWVEQHAEELKRKAVLYINSDTNDRGLLQTEASYSLQGLVDGVAADVPDPETGASIGDRARAGVQVAALAPDATPEMKARARSVAETGILRVGDMGSGSDYTPFVQHLGIASINLGFGGEGQSGGVYHSAYDTFEHFDRFGDPGFAYGVTLAKTAGRLVLRAADAGLDPYRFKDAAVIVAGQIGELKTLVADERQHALAVDRLIEAGAFRLAADPTRPFGVPDAETQPPPLDFAPLDTAAARLADAARRFDTAAARPPSDPERVNALLHGAEQDLTSDAGLPGRPWYLNLLYAPGLLTGYGAKTLPGVREAIEGHRWDEAQAYIAATAAALARLAGRLDEATRLLGAG
ncbi:MAG: M28 family peptidase, partial [Caulobacteraceae bacterium]|nr:M28 family peptidase [Caulobacteraceae bacterium]